MRIYFLYTFIKYLIALLLIILLFSCSSGKNQNTKNQEKANKMGNPEQSVKSPKPIPPNQVVAHIQIISAEEKNENFLCDIKILEILETGSSAGPLAVGNQINASMDKSLVMSPGEEHLSINDIHSEQIFLSRLSYQKTISIDNSHNWKIIKLQKQ